MSQSRQMTIALDRHMRMLEVGAAGRDREGQISYWRAIISHAQQIDGWFGKALAGRARWMIKNLGGNHA